MFCTCQIPPLGSRFVVNFPLRSTRTKKNIQSSRIVTQKVIFWNNFEIEYKVTFRVVLILRVCQTLRVGNLQILELQVLVTERV